MYCNHCSVFTNEAHFQTEEHINNSNMLNDILLEIVGGEKGLVKKVLGLKRGLEKEEITVGLSRFSWLDRFSKIKEMKVTNTFEKTIKIAFSPRGIFKNTYECELELEEPVSFDKLTTKQKEIFSTFDLALVKFMERGEKTKERMEELIKFQIKKWNLVHLDTATEKLNFKEYENINFESNQSPVPILRLNQ